MLLNMPINLQVSKGSNITSQTAQLQTCFKPESGTGWEPGHMREFPNALVLQIRVLQISEEQREAQDPRRYTC